MNQPADPITAMASAAIQIHEMYEAFVAAGFTEQQALELTKTALLIGR
ncbi:hypothetical protein ACFXD5_19610 [Streptomyces sp. NPDC059385]